MRADGNGNAEVCALNLLRISRGEIPYDRVRGRDAVLVDQPNSADDAVADAEWLLETYEPRINVDDVEITAEETPEGVFLLTADISRKEGQNE